MNLSRKNLAVIPSGGVVKPEERIFGLPEKVLQFGTGVLLRGLPDYFIDKANRQGVFNGRVVVVKSTDAGDSSAFDSQDGLYTLCVRGIEGGEDNSGEYHQQLHQPGVVREKPVEGYPAMRS